MKELIAPTIHLNGSSKESFKESYRESASALRKAIDGLQAPHARDYYVKGDGVYEKARVQHFARLEKLQDVLDEVMELWEMVESQ